MKKIMLCVLTLSSLASVSAKAEFSLQELQLVNGLAISEYARENSQHAQHITGWKTWKSGEGAKVKLYVAHDGMNMEHNYDCQKHGDGKLQCHAQ